MPRRLAPIGAHVSVAGGLSRALPRAKAIDAEAIQIFVANPRGWATPAPDPESDAAFAAECHVPVFVHAPYLINFGSPSPQTVRSSAEALAFSLRRAAAVNALGVVMHAGSAVLGTRWDEAMAQLRPALLRVLDSVPNGPRLLVEPTAGGGGALASDAESLAAYLDVIGRDERIGVCLDTCHMHAAGHDLAHDFPGALRAYARAAGPNRIGLVHVNDSRDPVGSKRDRHESIGADAIGTIGKAAFAALFASPATRLVPLVVESDETAHAADIAALKALRAEAGTTPKRLPRQRQSVADGA